VQTKKWVLADYVFLIWNFSFLLSNSANVHGNVSHLYCSPGMGKLVQCKLYNIHEW